MTWDKKAKNFYVRANIYIDKNHNTGMLLHRALLNKGNSKPRPVHHINGDPLDNRKSNLDFTTKEYNCKQRIKLNSNNTSGERNVSWNSRTREWMVQFQVNGRNKCFERFPEYEKEKAIKLARQLRKELKGYKPEE